jgi:hypothetical protein
MGVEKSTPHASVVFVKNHVGAGEMLQKLPPPSRRRWQELQSSILSAPINPSIRKFVNP